MSSHDPTHGASRGKRFAALAKMTASVAGRYTRDRLISAFQSEEDAQRRMEQAHADNGARMARTLGELKGAVMKVGQMASVAQDLLPPELAQALSSLQRDSPPMPFDLIAAQIERELGAHPNLLFRQFEEVPFAAASIGQVHRAVTDDGREVVVKVQYPGVDESCDADLNQLRLTLKMSGMIKSRAHKASFDALFEQLRARLHEELDYCLEADNVRRFGAQHAADDWLVIPQVVGERSAKRVLTLTFESGDPLEALATDAYDQDTRDRIGARLIQMFGAQVFIHHALHADPNPGNYAFRPDGTIVLYDFGCVETISPVVAAMYQDMARAMYEEDYAKLDHMLLLLGARHPDHEALPSELYARWRDILLLPFITCERYDYATSTIHEDARKEMMGAMRYADAFRPSPHLVFIDRVMVGLHNIFRMFGPRVPWRGLLEEFLAVKQVAYEDVPLHERS